MASGETAVSLALSSSPPPLLDHSPSNVSSPLSDVEDKGTDADETELNLSAHVRHRTATKPTDAGSDRDAGAESDSDGESKLSDIDINDSEAETERLYNTPPKKNHTRDALQPSSGGGNKQFTDRRDRAFERSPSKLQQQIRAEVEVANDESDNDSLSDPAEDDDAVSEVSSEPTAKVPNEAVSRSPSPVKMPKDKTTVEVLGPTRDVKPDTIESRKRKRSSVGAHSEIGQPARKRTGSISPRDHETSQDEAIAVADETASSHPHASEQSGEDDRQSKGDSNGKNKGASQVHDTTETSRSKRSKQRNSKKRKSPTPDEADKENGEAPDQSDEVGAAEDTGARTADEQLEADIDEEAEAAHRNEEESRSNSRLAARSMIANEIEVERKRAAWDELAAIEKQFSNFRERLYQERLEQLEKEEAMLTGSNPNHPEYLAMLQCIDERREDRIRTSNLQFRFKTDVLQKRVVAERAQILSQFYQSVREAREKVLEELGEEWYAIQHERRRHASSIPDFGLRFPANKTQTVRNAIAYNKEVSIISGFAKHVGFPAAPTIQGASDDQVDGDLEAIGRARQSVAPPAYQPPVQFHRESITSSMPFGSTLGPAGEQFIEQTPWANPYHPAHQSQRPQPPPQASPSAVVTGLSSGAQKVPQQLGSIFSPSESAVAKYDSPQNVHKAHPTGHENMKASKIGQGQVLKQSVATAS